MSSSPAPVRRPWRALAVLASAAMVVGLSAAPSSAAPGDRVDLRVLVVSNGGSNEQALARQLADEGVPASVVPLGDHRLAEPGFLSDTVNGTPRARYQSVVLPGARGLLTAEEQAALTAYETRFGVREVNAYVYPGSDVGMTVPTFAGTLDGRSATVTPDARADAFRYLRGPLTLDDNDPSVGEVYGYLAAAAPATATTSFTPLVTVDGSPVVGAYRDGGREQLIVTAAFNDGQAWFRTLAHGMVTWMTRGVHLGYDRSYFSVQVDDVLLPDSRWSTSGDCTPGDDCAPGVPATSDIRMTPADVTALLSWQSSRSFPLDLAFNAAGSVEAVANAGSDPLTTSLLAKKTSLRWLNHTYSHAYLGCLQDLSTVPFSCQKDASGATRWFPQASIAAQIGDNLAWASRNGVPVTASDLVTGEHSGLASLPQQPTDNPYLAPALTGKKITWVASDASREPAQRTIGSARTVMRHPMNIFYNVATPAEEVDEYNAIYTSTADGGKGICASATSTCIAPLGPNGFSDYIVPTEARIALSHVLGNDPRPHYAHQSNLAEGRILYPVLDAVLARYRAVFADNAGLVTLRLGEQGAALQRAAAWTAALPTGKVSAWTLDGRVHVENTAGVQVPLTVPASSTFGAAYAGERSGWTAAGAAPQVATGTTTSPGTTPAAQATPAATTGTTATSGPGAPAGTSTATATTPGTTTTAATAKADDAARATLVKDAAKAVTEADKAQVDTVTATVTATATATATADQATADQAMLAADPAAADQASPVPGTGGSAGPGAG